MTGLLRFKWLWVSLGLLILLIVFMISQLRFHGEVEKISFKSIGLEIEGVLVYPKGQGPHPAIVILHGSGGS